MIFLAITTATWLVGVAIYQSLLGGPDLRHSPGFVGATCFSILLVTLISFAPFPWGCYFSLAVWALAARGLLDLPWHRPLPLFVFLAALAFLSRFAILGMPSY